MDSSDSLDVQIGFYDHVRFWVEYHMTGTIGTYPPNPQLFAVMHFTPKDNLPPIPLGVLPQEQPGGFLRAKKTTYHLTVGKMITPGVSYNDRWEAQVNVVPQALNIAFAMHHRSDLVEKYRGIREKYVSAGIMFTVRCYGGAIPNRPQTILHSVIHFPEKLGRAAVPVVITDTEDSISPGYVWGFSPDGNKVEYVGRIFPEMAEANVQANSFIASIAMALMNISNASNPILKKLGLEATGENSVTGPKAQAEAQAAYDTLLNGLRTGKIQ